MIPHNRVCLTSDDERAVMAVLRSGWIGPGREVEAFEEELAARFRPGGAAACVSSGTAAIRLAVMILFGREPDRERSISTYSCSALYHALNGHVPLGTYWNVKVKDCDATLCASDASVVVHTYGVPCSVADDAISDFTHAPDASLDGTTCGSMGALSVISFGATKPLGCGSGGAVLGPPDLIAEIKDRRDYDGKRELRERFNYAWSDAGAALGRSRLKRLDEENRRRSKIAMIYDAARGAKVWDGEPAETRIWYRYVIRVPDPQAAIAHFAAHGVEAINPLEPWELLHRQLSLDPKDFPNAEDAAAHTVSLPIWPGMSDEQVNQVAQALETMEVNV